ncbi:MAG: hypothetical protein ACJ74G_03065, partial [Blastocatellia bacterium]
MALSRLLSRRTILALLIAGLLGGFGAWRLFFYASDFDKAVQAFVGAYRNDRVIEARVSALGYAPRRESRDYTVEMADQVTRARAQADLVDAAARNPGSKAENALGQFYLVNRQFHEAVEHLDKAVRLSPENAQFHSDFAAGLLEKGKADGEQAEAGSGQALVGQALKEFGQALEQAEEALRLDPALPPALFNRALCCQQLMLWNEARQGWENYLGRDATSPWAEEARKNLDRAQTRGRRETINEAELFQRFVRAYHNGDDSAAGLALRQGRNANGNPIVEELIAAFLAQPSEVRSLPPGDALNMLAYAARIEQATTGDAYLYDLWRYYRRTGAAQRRAIATARNGLSNSYKLLRMFDLPRASSGYEQTKKLFLAAGDGPEALWATFWTGRCYVLQPDIEQALPILQAVIKTAEARRYQDLRARALYALAM